MILRNGKGGALMGEVNSKAPGPWGGESSNIRPSHNANFPQSARQKVEGGGKNVDEGGQRKIRNRFAGGKKSLKS